MTQLLSLVDVNLASAAAFRPELTLTFGAMCSCSSSTSSGRTTLAGRPRLAVGALLVLGVAAVLPRHPAGRAAGSLFNGHDRHRRVRHLLQVAVPVAAGLTVLIAAPGKDFPPQRIGEFYALLMAMMLGMFLMASATDLLMVYLSIELVSLCSYVLAGFKKGDRRAAEASLKYVIYGGVASGVMLFGMSYLYGLLGTTRPRRAGLADVSHLQATGLPASGHQAHPGGGRGASSPRASATRSPRCPGTCGAPTCTRARRPRSPPSSRSAPRRPASRWRSASSTARSPARRR